MSHSTNIKKSKTDEWYTFKNSVDLIIPYLQRKGYKKIWCPFDTKESNFVKVLEENGFEVVYGHIDTGEDFLQYDKPPMGVECIASNPPFSLRNDILKKVFEWKMPFALIINSNGLFDKRSRFDLFKENKFELLIPKGRMKFFKDEVVERNSPNFQSIYVCSQLLPERIVFDDTQKF